MRFSKLILSSFAVSMFVVDPAAASFHVMQIEQVIGGVNGHTNVQAIQLRTRSSFQNFVSQGRLVAHDAAGANPVVLISFPGDVSPTGTGTRILAATADFQAAVDNAIAPDFLLTNPIPDSYLAAGSLTWEDNSGLTVYWRLSWGGASYTGSNTGSVTNDSNGNFGPPFAGPLPKADTRALLFPGTATAGSTTNAADYALTAGDATFTNSGGFEGTIDPATSVGPLGATGLTLAAPMPNPARSTFSYSFTLPREMRAQVRVVDLAGRTVRTLVDQRLGAGPHSSTWDSARHSGGALAGGVYFLELTAGGQRRVQRFVLLR